MALLLVLAVLPSIALGVAESQGKIIRAESKSSALHLSPHGELLEEKSKPKKAFSGSVNYDCHLADTCNCDFPVSDKADPQVNADSSGCRDVTSTTGKAPTPAHQVMDESDLCRIAAENSAAHTLMNPMWKADSTSASPRPMGCFKYPSCPNSASGVCYGYNTISQIAANDTARVTGAPVCQRNKYEFATPDTEGNTTCPEEYEPIHEEMACRKAVNCLGKKCTEQEMLAKKFQFMVGKINASRSADYPQGCFFIDDCGFFNKINSAIPRRSSVTGTSICRVTTTTCHGVHNGTHCVAGTSSDAATTAAPDTR